MSRRYPVTFVTGAPGAGKTTLARQLEQRSCAAKRLSIGELVLDAARREFPEVTYSELRELPDRFATPSMVRDATTELIRRVRLLEQHGPVVIESHAVTALGRSVRSTPFKPRDLTSLRISSIVLLYASPSELARRVSSRDGSDGRIVTTQMMEQIQRLQETVAVAYSGQLGCPLYVVDANQGVEEVRQSFEEVVQFEELGH